MKMMQGAFLRAVAKRSLTRDAPTPTNISTNSEPLTLKKGTCDSPAVALASSVLPVPGGPERMAPRGILAPNLWNRSGVLRKLTNSMISVLASSMPATSENLTLTAESWLNILALLLPKLNMLFAPPTPPPALRDTQKSRPTTRTVGPNAMRRPVAMPSRA